MKNNGEVFMLIIDNKIKFKLIHKNLKNTTGCFRRLKAQNGITVI